MTIIGHIYRANSMHKCSSKGIQNMAKNFPKADIVLLWHVDE